MLRRAFLTMIPGMATMLKSENPVVGGTVLRRAAIQSPNFITGSTGWAINQDGSAEFNNVVIRNGQVVSGTALYYSTVPPAANKLIASISSAGGTDSKGNVYLAGMVVYVPFGAIFIAVQINAGIITWYTAASEAGPWTLNIQAKYNTATGNLELGAPGAPALLIPDGVLAVTVKSQAGLIVSGGTADKVTLNAAAAAGLLLELINTSSPAAPNFRVTGAVAGDPAIALRIAGDTFNRLLLDDNASTGGRLRTGSGAVALDTAIYRAAANLWAADFIAFNNTGAPEVWQTVGGTGAAFANGWVNAAAPGTPLKYKRVCSPDHAVAWVGRIVAPAGVAAGQAITAAVAGVYQPLHTQKVAAINVTTGAAVRLTTGSAGVLNFQSGAAAGDSIDLGDLIYLDA